MKPQAGLPTLLFLKQVLQEVGGKASSYGGHDTT